ncbi:PaaI family thioesterase [Qingshengfaniella alkalisoli]|uniref:PaaI family thioesterase n=2 Tax=Qingshengfaniella alkalisoli TaxID=2599296 RepID=A0A5B8J076_9RHOB|nr:PaaI family thioesterase [Qingshengfaniella alkalisoli]
MEMIGPLLASKDADGNHFYALQTDNRHENRLGLIHGGAITTLLDQAIALIAWDAADRMPTVTLQMDTRFISAAKPGAFLVARAKARHTSRSIVFLDAELLDQNRLVATATAVMKILRKTQ